MSHRHIVRDDRPRPALAILAPDPDKVQAQAKIAHSVRLAKSGTDYTVAILTALAQAAAPMTRTAIGIRLAVVVHLLRPDMTRLLAAGTITETRTGRGRERVVYALSGGDRIMGRATT